MNNKKFCMPKKDGVIDVQVEVYNGRYVNVDIIGDPKGLKYLAKLLIALADYDQEVSSGPDGSREHIHLHPDEQLGDCSCEVSLTRADAKGTGEFPDFMK